ncbi:MAG TPA: hypothetical protein PKX38_06385 [Alphaproteobacteria bacterium]|nr:hypothetical protein [Micavibrio sp.]MBK9562705.1 hypothetical protein [Micavibrio sp.]HQX27548.1 hypothetical protein [Alphaproteobacteria bacterium]
MAILCSCNGIKEQDVDDYLLTVGDKKTTLNKVYKAASGGKKRDCNSCVDNFRLKVQEHNGRVEDQNKTVIPVLNEPRIPTA